MRLDARTRREDRNIFEDLLSWIDKLRAAGRYRFGLEEKVQVVERLLQDIGDSQLDQETTRRLSYWLATCRSADDAEEAVDAFSARLERLLLLLASAAFGTPPSAIIEEVRRIEPTPPKDWVSSVGTTLELTTEMLRRFMIERETLWSDGLTAQLQTALTDARGGAFSEILASSALLAGAVKSLLGRKAPSSIDQVARAAAPPPDRVDRDLKREAASFPQHTWTIDLLYYGNNAAAFGRLLWAGASSLEAISGVAVEIDSLRAGSFIARLKVKILNAWRRDEVQEVLSKARDGVEAQYVGKPVAEVDRLEAEADKLRAESQLLARQATGLPSKGTAQRLQDMEVRKKELELDLLAEDIVAKRIANEKAILDNARLASDLLKDGIIAADPVRVDVNGYVFLSLRNGVFKRGVEVKRLSEGESPTDTPEASS